MENLLELRNEIDAIDKEIVGLFQKRMKISSEVAEYKISTGKKVFDRAREEEKIRGQSWRIMISTATASRSFSSRSCP